MTTLKTLKTLLLTSALGLALGLPSLDASRALAQGEPPPSAEPGTADSPENDAEDAAESRATGFRAVSGAQAEDVPGGLMLVGAYGVIAVLLLLFLLRQRSQLQALAERITALRGEIERKGAEQNQR